MQDLRPEMYLIAGRHHPEEQGLKQRRLRSKLISAPAGRHHPEEQGLKLLVRLVAPDSANAAGRHHPEEQGLKQNDEIKTAALRGRPVGIIQKNKD